VMKGRDFGTGAIWVAHLLASGQNEVLQAEGYMVRRFVLEERVTHKAPLYVRAS